MAQPIEINGAKPKYMLLEASFYESPLHSARKALEGRPVFSKYHLVIIIIIVGIFWNDVHLP